MLKQKNTDNLRIKYRYIMSKSESTLLNMVVTLLVVTAIAGAGMGFVYKLTKEPIEEARRENKITAIKEVIQGFDNDPATESYKMLSSKGGGDSLIIYPAKQGGELIGVAIETISKKGFAGDVKIMVGMKPDGTIINYKVLEHKETPGLGTKMADWFKSDNKKQSIIDKNPGTNKLTVSKDGGEIDAITAATISSRAFLDAIQTAYDTYMGKTDAGSSASTKVKKEEVEESDANSSATQQVKDEKNTQNEEGGKK